MTTVIVGGGASGMMAAYSAAICGKNVILIEKNEKLGKKVYITGKGRCNVTNNVDVNEFLTNVVTNPKFLYGALNSLSPENLIEIFTKNGLQVKTERGNRVFPLSDKASDIIKFFEKQLISLGVDIRLNTRVVNLIVENGTVIGVETNKGKVLSDSVVVCTGGISYPLTGSTGDGYNFAKNLGHKIVEPKPSLVGIELVGNDFISLQGLSLKNVSVTVFDGNKQVFTDFGEMLFTHFGVSGPIILSSSCFVNKFLHKKLNISIDLKPALSIDILSQRLVREFEDRNQKNLFNAMRSLLPKSLIEVVLKRAKVSPVKMCSQVTKEERLAICNVLKSFSFDIKGLRPIDEAIVTAGGVSVNEINPKTMQSKLVNGLYFCGEVLDVDAFTGGFNLQIAFSTGYIAGINC